MKQILTIIAIFNFFVIYAQSNFERGYNKGYEEGYCYDKSMKCIKPIVPIAPIPKIGEDLKSYKDGYNRGFTDGVAKEKTISKNSLGVTENESNYTDYIYKPNLELHQQLAKKKVDSHALQIEFFMKIDELIEKGYYDEVIEILGKLKTLPEEKVSYYLKKAHLKKNEK